VNHINELHIRADQDAEFRCHWKDCPRRGRGFNARSVCSFIWLTSKMQEIVLQVQDAGTRSHSHKWEAALLCNMWEELLAARKSEDSQAISYGWIIPLYSRYINKQEQTGVSHQTYC
jgi:hypothetical protein